MTLVSVDETQLVTVLVMAVALGMDALSLGIGIGMKGIRLRDVLKISVVVAIFHTTMPLFGVFAGHYVGSLLGDVAVAVGGGLLTILGLHMIYSALRGEEVQSFDHSSVPGLILFSLSVSIDSFSVGVSMGIFDMDLILTALMFGVFGGLMSIIGLLIGRRASSLLGSYGEALGGMILLAFGVKFLI
mgnify:CR=1 FL=1